MLQQMGSFIHLLAICVCYKDCQGQQIKLQVKTCQIQDIFVAISYEAPHEPYELECSKTSDKDLLSIKIQETYLGVNLKSSYHILKSRRANHIPAAYRFLLGGFLKAEPFCIGTILKILAYAIDKNLA